MSDNAFLRPELAVLVAEAAELQFKGQTYAPSLLQVFTGGPMTGKTVQAGAYAIALYGAGLVDDAALSIVCCANFTTRADLKRIVDTAKGKVLAIDEFDKFPRDRAISDLLVDAVKNANCILVLTGPESALQDMKEHHPDLFALLPKPLLFEKSFLREMDQFNALEDKRTNAKIEAEEARRAVMARRSLCEAWRQMGKVDVSLPIAIKPVKTVRFRPKVQP